MMSNQAGLGIGDKVHNQEINEFPKEWKEEYLRVSNWAKNAAEQFGRGLVITIIDPQSLVGMWKALRYGIRGYPTMIIDGREKFTGWDVVDDVYARLQELIPSA